MSFMGHSLSRWAEGPKKGGKGKDPWKVQNKVKSPTACKMSIARIQQRIHKKKIYVLVNDCKKIDIYIDVKVEVNFNVIVNLFLILLLMLKLMSKMLMLRCVCGKILVSVLVSNCTSEHLSIPRNAFRRSFTEWEVLHLIDRRTGKHLWLLLFYSPKILPV